MLAWQSVLVGLQVLSGGAILGDAFPESTVGLFILAVSAAQAGTAFYQSKRTETAVEGLE